MRFTTYEPSRITIYNKHREKVLEELSLVAVDYTKKPRSRSGQGGEIISAGTDVRGQTFGTDIFVGSFLKDGLMAECTLGAKALQYLLKKAGLLKETKIIGTWWPLRKPKIALCVPLALTQSDETSYWACLIMLDSRAQLIFEKTYADAALDIPADVGVIIEITP